MSLNRPFLLAIQYYCSVRSSSSPDKFTIFFISSRHDNILYLLFLLHWDDLLLRDIRLSLYRTIVPVGNESSASPPSKSVNLVGRLPYSLLCCIINRVSHSSLALLIIRLHFQFQSLSCSVMSEIRFCNSIIKNERPVLIIPVPPLLLGLYSRFL